MPLAAAKPSDGKENLVFIIWRELYLSYKINKIILYFLSNNGDTQLVS